MSDFGKRTNTRISVLDSDQVSERSGVDLIRERSDKIVDRDTGIDFQLPDIHNTHLERYWPRYGGVAAMLFAIGYYVNDGKTEPLQIILPAALFGLFSFWLLRTFRNSLNALHQVRTPTKRTKAFVFGMGAGFLYWAYSTFLDPQTVLGQELGIQTTLYDGVQREDLAAIAILLLKACVYAVLGGALFEFVNKRIIGATA